MAQVVDTRVVKVGGGRVIFERWDDGTISRRVEGLAPTGSSMRDVYERAERSLALHQLGKSETPWFPGSVMSRTQAAAVLGLAESAVPADVSTAYEQRSNLYAPSRFSGASEAEQSAAAQVRRQLGEARIVLTATERVGASSGDQRADGAAYASPAEAVLMEAARGAARRALVKALLWLSGGVVATLIGYAATPSGDGYLVFWGAILYGAYRTVIALYYVARPQALLRKAMA